jgi:hypothetical protein
VIRRTYSLSITLLAAMCALILSGCIMESYNDKLTDAAVVYGVGSSASNDSACAANAFRQAVHVQLRANCASCHSGSGPGTGAFASSDLNTAYSASIQRTNMNNPGGSLLVSRSAQTGHGGNCGACGPTWGAALTNTLAIWARAEAGNPATCAEYATASDTNTPNVDPFDLGPYIPANPSDTVITQAGLTEFSKANGVHAKLRANCAQCHITSGVSSFAAFSVNDATTAYRAAKPRLNISNYMTSLLISRAAVPNHGGGCTVCGTPAFMTPFQSSVQAWAQQEGVGAQELSVSLTPKTIGLTDINSTNTVTLTWNLALLADNPRASTAYAGASFSIQVKMSGNGSNTYRLQNPRLVTGSSALRVKKIQLGIDNTLNPNISTFAAINTTVAANNATGQVLSAATALLPGISTSSTAPSVEKIKIVFEILQP